MGGLGDPSALMRVSAIQALEALDAKEAIPQLQELLNDRALPGAGPRVPVADTAKATIRRLHEAGRRRRLSPQPAVFSPGSGTCTG